MSKKGICINFAHCEKARLNQPIEVTGAFECPECKCSLRPVDKSGRVRLLAAALALAMTAGLGMLVWQLTSDRLGGTPVVPPLPPPPVENPPPPPVENPPPPPVEAPPRPAPSDPDPARRDEAQREIIEGRRLMARGEREAAREAFDRATRLDSGNGFAWANRGAADMLLGDAESARRAYRRALEVDGDNWLAHYNLGVYYARSQAGGAALESLSKSVAALRRSGAGVEVAAVLNDLETNSVFSEMRHDPRFRELLTRLR